MGSGEFDWRPSLLGEGRVSSSYQLDTDAMLCVQGRSASRGRSPLAVGCRPMFSVRPTRRLEEELRLAKHLHFLRP